MGKASRTKGVAGEREVAALYTAAGFDVRGLEGGGDHFVACGDGLVVHSETKWQEKIKIQEWWAQTVAEAPKGSLPVLAFRRSREEWKAVVRLEDLIALMASGAAKAAR